MCLDVRHWNQEHLAFFEATYFVAKLKWISRKIFYPCGFKTFFELQTKLTNVVVDIACLLSARRISNIPRISKCHSYASSTQTELNLVNQIGRASCRERV